MAAETSTQNCGPAAEEANKVEKCATADSGRPASSFAPLHIAKHVLSFCLEMAALFVIIYGMYKSHAVLQANPAVLVVIFIFCVTLLAYLEGLQVAILALEGVDGTGFKDTHPRAFAIQSLMLKNENVQRFLVGRQFYVIFVVYLCAQVTTFPTIPSFGMPETLKVILIDTGLPGAIFVLAVGQLMPQLTAQRYPVDFLNIRGSYIVVGITLVLESIGITHFSWLLTEIVCWLFFSSSKRTDGAKAKTQTSSVSGTDPSKAFNQVDPETGDVLSATASRCAALAKAAADAGLLESVESAPAIIGKEQEQHWYTPQAGKYVQPSQVLTEVQKTQDSVPKFLLPPMHKDHVPPHVVAFDLLAKVQALESEIAKLREVDAVV